MPPNYENIFGQMARRIDVLEREVRTLRKAPPTVTPARPHPQFTDDFVGGNVTTGSVGELGWSFTGGSVSVQNSSNGHPGIMRFSTGAGAGTLHSTYLGSSTVTSSVRVPDTWSVRAVFRAGTTVDADTMYRVGLGLSPTANPPTNGCYLEKLATDTTFYGVCRNAGVQTRSQILTTAGAAMSAVTASRWYRVRVRRASATAIGFTVEETVSGVVSVSYPEVLITTNIPATANGIAPFWQVHNGAVAAERFLDADFAELQMMKLAR